MKHTLIPTIIFSALTLTACGGGGGGGDTSSSGSDATQSQNQGQNQSPAPRPKLASVSQVIDYYGDSTVWGWAPNGGGARVQTPAPATFAASLPSTPTQTVNNKGVNGQTACQLLNGANGQNDWRTLLAESNATVVILNHGINDFTATNIADQVDVGTYRGCLTSLATQAKEANKRVIFETPNPIAQEGLAPYVQAMKDVATQQNIPVIDQYAYLNGLLAGNDVSTLMPDGIHPSQSTYDVKGRYAAARFVEIDL